MDLIAQFITVFIQYIQELWLSVAAGFLISGLFFEFIPAKRVEEYLGSKGISAILIASCVGMALPVCCFGSLPIAMTLHRKGARLGPVLAFLVATPATSVSAIIVCWKLLGALFTIYIIAAVMVMGLTMGLVGNLIRANSFNRLPSDPADCCHLAPSEKVRKKDWLLRVRDALRYAFITLPREIGLELLIGVAVASFIIIFQPVQDLLRYYLSGGWGYAFVLIFGLATYVCSTASVPMADALLQSGLNSGHAMTYLLVGPITSYGMIFVIRKEFGMKILVIYLGTISILSILFGLGFQGLADG